MLRIRRMAFIFIIFFIPLAADAQDRLMDSVDRVNLTNTAVSSAFVFAGTFVMDESLRSLARYSRGSFMNDVTHYTNYLGSKKIVLPVNALLLAGGMITDDHKLKHTSCNALKSLLSSSAVTLSIKYLTGRSRPYTDKGAFVFDPLPADEHAFKSLPSGHATLAFAFFTPFAEEYSRWLYALPITVGFSRIYKDKHWTSDVVMGAAIGFFSGYFFQHKNRNIEISLNKIVIKF